LAGLIPGVGEPFDLLNGGISLLRGNYLAAGLSLGAALLPFGGQGFTALKHADDFAGVRALSQTLRQMGISRAERLQIIESFVPGTITAKVADGSESFLRFFGGERSRDIGRYLSESFPSSGTARSAFALPPWNEANEIAQFAVRPGTTYFTGTAAANFGYLGGGRQIFVPDTSMLRRLR
jgi:hypothetical protein